MGKLTNQSISQLLPGPPGSVSRGWWRRPSQRPTAARWSRQRSGQLLPVAPKDVNKRLSKLPIENYPYFSTNPARAEFCTEIGSRTEDKIFQICWGQAPIKYKNGKF